jgi:hypothetical protein
LEKNTQLLEELGKEICSLKEKIREEIKIHNYYQIIPVTEKYMRMEIRLINEQLQQLEKLLTEF